jgi:hypothetical protein
MLQPGSTPCPYFRNVSALEVTVFGVQHYISYAGVSPWDGMQTNHPAVFDIEDLVQLGRKFGSCPYFVSRALHEKAQLVLCPYNYVVRLHVCGVGSLRPCFSSCDVSWTPSCVTLWT